MDRRRIRVNTDRDAEIVRSRNDGETYQSISKRFGISPERVRQVFYYELLKAQQGGDE